MADEAPTPHRRAEDRERLAFRRGRYLLDQLNRVKWAILFLCVPLYLRDAGILDKDLQSTVMLMLVSRVSLGAILANILRQTLFPSIHLQDWIHRAWGAEDREERRTAAIALIGPSIITAAVFGTIMLSIAMGLGL